MDHGHTHHTNYGHAGGHAHAHAPASYDRTFALGIGLNIAFVAVELAAGVIANSLALLADAGHNAFDVIGLLLAWGADWLARGQPTERHTYGYRRAPILAALVNAALLLIAVGAMAWEAVQRLWAPEAVASPTIIVVALIGIAINGLTAWMFARGSKHDLNIRGAFLHMATDAIVSLGVVVAGILMLWTNASWIDPAVSLIVAAIILVGTWSLARNAVDLALDAVPAGIDRSAVEAYLAGLPGVSEVHDLHIWALSTRETALTAHLVRPRATLDDRLLAEATRALRERFGIGHATLQIEHGGTEHPCQLAPHNVV
jgi:cobalt-zinc-cadmium efflux system protein